MILAGPSETPVTTPTASTVALAVLLLLHTPPDIALASAVVEPIQTDEAPVLAGTEPTVMLVVAMQPVPVVNVIVAIPPLTPETTPLAIPTVATDVLLLLQATPFGALLARAIVEPTHTVVAPVIAGTAGLTVTWAVRAQPVEVNA
jgi:hypothetical protein